MELVPGEGLFGRSASNFSVFEGERIYAKYLDDGEARCETENTYAFEASWEVANKVTGIYTVLKTKAAVSVKEYGNNYFMMGPYIHEYRNLEFEEVDTDFVPIQHAISKLEEEESLIVRCGRWLIEGYPNLLLFDIRSGYKYLDSWKTDLWNTCSIGVPISDEESNHSLVIGFMVAKFMKHFIASLTLPYRVVGHFHEWKAGIGLIISKMWRLDLATVFTAHSTLIGRYLSTKTSDFYSDLKTVDVDRTAGDAGFYHKYCIERAAAHCSHIFTAVGRMVAVECEHYLGRKPDYMTPNGLNGIFFPSVHEFQNMHAIAKEKIHDFIRGHFTGSYNFDLDKILYFFTAGSRYEFSNKGGDLFVRALHRLNHMLKTTSDKRCAGVTVVAFFVFSSPYAHKFNAETLKRQASAKKIKETTSKINKDIAQRIFEAAMKGHLPNNKALWLREEEMQLKKCSLLAKERTLPPICTHEMSNDAFDPVLVELRKFELFNKPEDRVKVIFHPEYLSSVSPLFGLDYEDFVRGCHLAVLPSYHEPWGYTPAECVVKGVPCVTSDLSGFGCFMKDHLIDPPSYGIYIVDRRFNSSKKSVAQLAEYLFDFCKLTRRQRIITRNRTERLTDFMDWKNLGILYRSARLAALKKIRPHEEIEVVLPNILVPRPHSAPSTPKSILK